MEFLRVSVSLCFFGWCLLVCVCFPQLAEKQGTYETYEGSPASQGLLQFDMWGVTPSKRWDWAGLKVQQYDGAVFLLVLINK